VGGEPPAPLQSVETPGVKFADGDLIGCPVRVTVSRRSLQQSGVEASRRGGLNRTIVPRSQLEVAIQPLQLSELCRVALTWALGACYPFARWFGWVEGMIRERVADNVYVFTSDLYAQVNAGAVVGPDWSVLIDTLALPEEAREIREFLEVRLSSPVRYVINTHYHADHSFGNCWFQDAVVISHAECRHLLDTRGREGLREAQESNKEFREVRVVLPEVVFEHGNVGLRIGKRTLQLVPLAGHSPDGVGVLLVEDRVLFSGDIMMPVPYLVDGDYEAFVESLKRIPRMKLENLVQGHGEVILRGEVANAVRGNLNYLAALRRHVRKASRRRDPRGYLETVDVEDCGKARILLNGLAEELHRRNLFGLYAQLYGQS
jgi:glyoxylase-like metal-dependent hydrolase (beta-lactamase superfamily II)